MARDDESHASVYRKAVQESTRTELNRELNKIYEAKYVAVYPSYIYRGGERVKRDTVYCYGTRAECEKFADGLRDVKVRAITIEDQNELAKGKRQAYRNP